MDKMKKYLQSLNPKPSDELIPGCEYNLWSEEKHIGIATWTLDENVGDSFQRSVLTKDGVLVQQVFLPDKWELIIYGI